MEKKYIVIDTEKATGGTQEDSSVVYSVDSPFKTYLYNEAVRTKKTDLDRVEFDRTLEVYKILKEVEYLGYDRITVEAGGDTYVFSTPEEMKNTTKMLENRIISIKDALKKVAEQMVAVPKNRTVVYTCITGGYDNILEPSYVTPGVDYICFTDNMSMKSKTWKFRPIPEDLLSYSKVKQQRGVKILAHRYLSDYDISIWVDGAVIVKGDVNEFLKTLDTAAYSVFIPEHPARKCIYAEKDACVRLKKIKGDEVALADRQMKRYKDEGFPTNYGLVQSNVMVRCHNDQRSRDLMERWWSELKDYSHRDQLSFNYALWKMGGKGFKYLIKTTCNSKTFNWIKVHRKK
jgi:hypothetical protein